MRLTGPQVCKLKGNWRHKSLTEENLSIVFKSGKAAADDIMSHIMYQILQCKIYAVIVVKIIRRI